MFSCSFITAIRYKLGLSEEKSLWKKQKEALFFGGILLVEG
jgi:hypothetical protein